MEVLYHNESMDEHADNPVIRYGCEYGKQAADAGRQDQGAGAVAGPGDPEEGRGVLLQDLRQAGDVRGMDQTRAEGPGAEDDLLYPRVDVAGHPDHSPRLAGPSCGAPF